MLTELLRTFKAVYPAFKEVHSSDSSISATAYVSFQTIATLTQRDL